MQYIVPDKVNFLTVFHSLSLKQPPTPFLTNKERESESINNLLVKIPYRAKLPVYLLFNILHLQ